MRWVGGRRAVTWHRYQLIPQRRQTMRAAAANRIRKTHRRHSHYAAAAAGLWRIAVSNAS